jgi:hypothetical protein
MTEQRQLAERGWDEPGRRRTEGFAGRPPLRVDGWPGEGARVRALARRKRRQRRRLSAVAVVLVLGALLVTADLVHLLASGKAPVRPAAATGATSAAPTGSASAQAAASVSAPAASGSATPGVPTSGPGTYAYAPADAQVVGAAGGKLKKYRVAVENGIGQDAKAFAEQVRQLLADARGWTAGGDLKFQQVAEKTTADFTIFLATPTSSEKLCSAGGIHTDQQLSCRLPGQVILNLARWLGGVSGYGAPLTEYQAFELNHQLGRELGHQNEACPAPGQPAPVMQQQALGLKGCTPNGWPYRNGKLYQGPPVP